jgi:hypothetical protein
LNLRFREAISFIVIILLAFALRLITIDNTRVQSALASTVTVAAAVGLGTLLARRSLDREAADRIGLLAGWRSARASDQPDR